MMTQSRTVTKELEDFYHRDNRGKLHLNVKSVLFGGYDPEETGEMIEQINTYYRDLIVDLVREIAEKDHEITELKKTKE